MSTQPVIIEVAINGAVTKERNPTVPVTPEEIAAEALSCFGAGASIVHAHCSPITGAPADVAARYLAAFTPVWSARPGALIYPTLNVHNAAVDLEHLTIMAAHGLRIGLYDPGCRNLGGPGPDGLLHGQGTYAQSYDAIGRALALHADAGLGPSLAIYEPGWLRTMLVWWRAGALPPGAVFKLYLSEDRGLSGAPFGLPVSVAGLEAYLELLSGCPVPWMVSAVGGDLGRSDVAPAALARGGHLHVGLEFFGGPGVPTNTQLVREAVGVCEAAGRTVASCEEAARIMGLPR